MKRFLLVVLCVVFFAGFADFGHAFWFFGGGGGGKSSKSRTALDTGSLFENNYQVFSNVPTPSGNNTNPNYFAGNSHSSHPVGGPGSHGRGSPNFGNGNNDRDRRHEGGRTSQPVPEPATMLLLGAGLIALAGYGRKKFKS